MTKEDKNKKLVLLDTHAILHRAYHALPEFATSKGEPTGALYGLSTMLLKIITDIKPDYIAACYDLPKPTYRHEAYKEYKAGRAKTDDGLITQIKNSRKIFEALGIPMYDKEGFEADDMLGTIVEKMKKEKGLDIVIASGDMDTLQLVVGDKVRVYTLKKGIKDTIIYNEDAVRTRFGFGPELLPDYKGLRGDPSDNIIGIKGIGEKTASDLIQKFGSIEDIYKKLKKDKKAFLEAGIKERMIGLLEEGEEEAKFSKMLGTIRKDAPIDFKIPEKTWSANVNFEKISAVWAEMEFRTLGPRLVSVLKSAGQGGMDFGATSLSEEKMSEEDMSKIDTADLRGVSIALWLINSNFTNPSVEDIFSFTNTRDFEKAKGIIFDELKKRGLNDVFEKIEKPLISIIDKMEKAGVKIDRAELDKLSKKYHTELSSIEKKIWEYCGTEFNINSPKQLGEMLFVKMGLKAKNQKKTGSGALSTKESELEKMKDLHPVIALILSHRELQKLLTTYIDVIPELLDKEGRLHAKFLQAGTTTGRLSSQEPNLQNIPNHSELGRNIRAAFIADSGYKLLSFDYSQVEIRIAAFLSGDKKLIEIFKKGEDVHTAVASEVFGVSLDKVDKEMRRKAKVINFGIMYGMGVSALKQNLGTSREEAQKFLDDYFAKFSGLAEFLVKTKAEAKAKGYTETLFGRRRYFEGLDSKLPFIRAMAERMAINAPIQGTEADIIKLAMIEVDKYLNDAGLSEDVRLILQVHDELVYEVKESLIKKVVPKIKALMESVVPTEKTFGIVCMTEASMGDSWKEMGRV